MSNEDISTIAPQGIPTVVMPRPSRHSSLPSQRTSSLPSQRTSPVPSQRSSSLPSQRTSSLPNQRTSSLPSQRNSHSSHRNSRRASMRFPPVPALNRKRRVHPNTQLDPIAEIETPAPTLTLALERNLYFPGQTVKGQLWLDAKSYVGVERLRVAVIGKVRVMGDKPETPGVAPGLFDYKKDSRVLDVGLRLVRNWRLSTTEEKYDDGWVRTNDGTGVVDSAVRELIQIRQVLGMEPLDDDGGDDSVKISPLRAPSPSVSIRSTTKSAQDKFLLEPDHHLIPFELTIPETTSLPGTFQHQCFSISYTVVANLTYRFDPSSDRGHARASKTITLVPLIPTTTPIYNTPLTTPSKKTPITVRSRRPSGASTHSARDGCFGPLATSLLSHVASKPVPTGYIEQSVHIPYRAFVPGQPIPLKVHLANHSDIDEISRVMVQARLIRHVVVTAGLGETIEYTECAGVIGVFDGDIDDGSTQLSTVVPTSESHNGAGLTARKMDLDMKGLLQVPNDCAYTVFSDTTHGTFEVCYEVIVKVKVIEAVVGHGNASQKEGRAVALRQAAFPVIIGSVLTLDDAEKLVRRATGRERRAKKRLERICSNESIYNGICEPSANGLALRRVKSQLERTGSERSVSSRTSETNLNGVPVRRAKTRVERMGSVRSVSSGTSETTKTRVKRTESVRSVSSGTSETNVNDAVIRRANLRHQRMWSEFSASSLNSKQSVEGLPAYQP
ncbi:hypothetical protein BC938DRAFT_481453 [Jimgerdemannia flammicorona]|uniref:Arrestin C-terminal-like domain-containing protein n=1 Tax=Jimgerdemannia flammicorona TaxID=994334 RepID=A0A433QG71_9FUNG|nr:hypothetical protein BC938DRAFT_481453 [Jimgerdemannia flammicorona]